MLIFIANSVPIYGVKQPSRLMFALLEEYYAQGAPRLRLIANPDKPEPMMKKSLVLTVEP
jgi:hypothetical protein